MGKDRGRLARLALPIPRMLEEGQGDRDARARVSSPA
jgi:hypothetical protein